MESFDDLPLVNLLALKQIGLTGLSADRRIVSRLLEDEMILRSSDGRLILTGKGRRMLVRGSPLLWDVAS